ncbi:MAG TPA: amidohydrolase family protein, partial [Bacteroidales bacterium]|nr:amidohydrolase family protein [Bacteroidales bacterium]
VIDEPVRNATAPSDVFRFTEEMILKWNNHPRVSFGVAVHAPYTVQPELYQQGKALADKHATILHTHLAETKWEFDLIQNRYGLTPVNYLENIGVLGNNLVAAHAIHVTPSDIELFAKYDVGILHNPQCNMKLASGTAPVAAMLGKGINVALGTDGAASNNDLDIFDEMRTAALVQKMLTSDPKVMDARTVVATATITGARALRLDASIGSIEPGKQADLILLALDHPHSWPNYNVYSLIVYSLRGSDVHSVMVAGRWLMKNKKLLCINEEYLYHRLLELFKSISNWKQSLALAKYQATNRQP